MAVVCPTITPLTVPEYYQQMAKVAPFASRLQIDLMDSEFAGSASLVTPDDVWWPPGREADIHLMYQDPFKELGTLKQLRPSLVIIHVETMVHHMHFAAELHAAGIRAGLALLPETPVENVEQILHSFDHLLIFSGDLGHFGGEADLGLAAKAGRAKEHYPDLEVGWDGGINPDNIRQLAGAGVDVLNVGGFIQNSDSPLERYNELVERLA